MANKEQYEKMKRGEPYFIDDYLFSIQAETAKKLAECNALGFGDPKRETIMRSLFGFIGSNVRIKEDFRCNYGFNISIGDDCFFNYGVIILDSFTVKIGRRVFLAPRVTICPVTHPLEAKERKNLILGEVVIEDDVWIGANSIILPGVTIGRGAVIGAQSLVKTNVPPYTVYGGVPAHYIKDIPH